MPGAPIARRIVTHGIVAGAVAAAATGGALIGFGRARGSAFRPLNAIAHAVLGSRAFLFDAFDPLVTTLGVVVHLVSLLLWGLLFAALVQRLRGWALAAAGLLFAWAAYAIDYGLVPERLRPGFETALLPREIGVVYVVLALSLAAGVKLSHSSADIE
ncbi:MAG: hypothetical protein ABJD07_06235 [Gemmatimonadaceae bacterium]